MYSAPEELSKVAERVRSEGPQEYSVRTLLSWYRYERRSRYIVDAIRKNLEELKLTTDPDIEYAYLDGPLVFHLVEEPEVIASQFSDLHEESLGKVVTEEPDDPTQRIGKLPSANLKLISVGPNATVSEAVTLMLLYDYSQLPVMQGDRSLKGVVTWKSIGSMLALNRPCVNVRDCLDEAVVINADSSLFSAIPTIVERAFVLIEASDKTISGIVTTTDLSLQFRQLAEPFLLLGEIEMHLRRLADGKFTRDDLSSLKDPGDVSRDINSLSDLTFGEHVRLLENPSRWSTLGLNIDRATFVEHLKEIRDIRNDVMHFDPDGTAPTELEKLRQFVRLLDALSPPQ
ncbi:CBS domain-containing protein [Pseudomonas sp. DWRC2-2]|uniref:CBS domain-containing protein n=1 Tax=Pseudomonas sp. DWRC2-2 TaxID=2804567 RepID=UPI003CF0A580